MIADARSEFGDGDVLLVPDGLYRVQLCGFLGRIPTEEHARKRAHSKAHDECRCRGRPRRRNSIKNRVPLTEVKAQRKEALT